MMSYRFPARIADDEVIRPKQFTKLPGCRSATTFNAWLYTGLLNSSRTERIKLPSKKINGARATTLDAYNWWQEALQT